VGETRKGDKSWRCEEKKRFTFSFVTGSTKGETSWKPSQGVSSGGVGRKQGREKWENTHFVESEKDLRNVYANRFTQPLTIISL